MKSMLKMFILKHLSSKPMSGYDIMKEWEQILGYKPSAGAVYPTLKGLENDGFIKGVKKGRKTLYHLTPKGKNFIEEIIKIKQEFYEKMHSHILATAEIFNDRDLKMFCKREGMFKKYPLLLKIILKLEEIEEEKARAILKKIYEELKKCKGLRKCKGKL